MKKEFTAIGVMSGTSLDGLDITAAKFYTEENNWHFEWLASACYPYGADWKDTLLKAKDLSIEEYVNFDVCFGRYIGKKVNQFLQEKKITGVMDVIGSHGHTIHHDPAKGFSLQAASGAHIAAITGMNVVSDLRSGDVALGGQGAPIIPIGEKYLFPKSNCFLNIGGISNISFHTPEKVIAYDIGPGNTPANYLSNKLGKVYDRNGDIGRAGKPDEQLMQQLNQFSFYGQPLPRSLHTDKIMQEFMPILDKNSARVEDQLCSYYRHLAQQIHHHIESRKAQMEIKSLMITGGGAYNRYLVELIRETTNVEVVVPDDELVEFKEALVMGFFAVLRILNIPNCLASVTGASKDNCSGTLHKA